MNLSLEPSTNICINYFQVLSIITLAAFAQAGHLNNYATSYSSVAAAPIAAHGYAAAPLAAHGYASAPIAAHGYAAAPVISHGYAAAPVVSHGYAAAPVYTKAAQHEDYYVSLNKCKLFEIHYSENDSKNNSDFFSF